MITEPLSAIAVIIVAASFCQWLASRVKVPSVVFQLVAGVSLSSFIDPDAIFGELLFTGVGLGVAILSFEGGTGLNRSRLQTGKAPVLRLVTIGAAVGIVVLDAIIEERAWDRLVLRVITTFAAGMIVGALAGGFLVTSLRRHLIADHLHIPATFAVPVAAYAGADALRPEAGLITATVLGMALANQRRASALHIAEFNEHLGSIVLGVLFIVLGARVDLASIVDNLGAGLIIIAALVLIALPLTVVASTLGTQFGPHQTPDRILS